MRESVVAPTVVDECSSLCAQRPAGETEFWETEFWVAMAPLVVGRGPRRYTRCRGLMSCRGAQCPDPVPFGDRELGLFPGRNAKFVDWLSLS